MIPDNYTTISLFGIEMNPPRGISLGSLDIRFYGVVIALGLILAVVYGLRQKKRFGLTEDQILDGVLIIVPISIICARLFYCIFEWESYKAQPIKILYIWEGGLAIFGAVIGALTSVVIYCKVRKISVGATLDLTVLGFLIGQSIGRWGNFFNREAVGQLAEGTNWFLKMGLLNKYTNQFEYFHPTFLYESVWNAIGFVVLHQFRKKRRYDGQITLLYCAWYGLGRTMIEGLRMDSLYLGPFRVNQLLAGGLCIVATITLLVLHFRNYRPELYVNRMAAPEAEEISEEAVEETEEAAETTEETEETAQTPGEEDELTD